MQLIDQVNPSSEQFKKLMAAYPKDTPISMLNILRYKDQVDLKKTSGEAVYQQYLKEATPFIKKVNGRLIWKGTVHSTLIGSEENQPHIVFIVTYPSIDHFEQMLRDPEYLEVAKLRTMSIEYGGLIATQQEYPRQ